LATGSGLVMALYLGVVATGVAYVLFGFGLRRLSTATAVTLVLAEPLTAALLAVVVLDESIPVLGWLGVVAVMAGLVLVGRSASGTPRRTG
jgi:drug/metabolite transporter, DME family